MTENVIASFSQKKSFSGFFTEMAIVDFICIRMDKNLTR